MNIELALARKLKEAGFPQSSLGLHLNTGDEDIFYPTLSELIKECGDNFFALAKNAYLDSPSWSATPPGKLGMKGGFGHTPEEAVSNLYIKLHEKNIK